ncbi:MAG: tetratricopeptide repeat protein, partial [Chloroflexi bacterium]|nr:tetratricopeptide repeat protein [Chloroflexota bacterium]
MTALGGMEAQRDLPVALASIEGRRTLFRQHVLRAGAFALRYSREHRHDGEALDRQRDNILQAMDACSRYAGAWAVVVDVALTIHDYMERRGYWEVWEQYLELAVEASRRLGNAPAEGKLLNHLGAIRRHRGQRESVVALHERALQIFQGLQDDAGIVRSRLLLGHQWWLRGRWDRAREHFEAALPIAERAGAEADLAHLYAGMSHTHSSRGEWEKVLEWSRRAGPIAERLGDTALLAQVHNDMGYACWQLGRWTEARRLFGQAMDCAERGGDQVGLAIACNNLAALLLNQGEWEPALALLKRELGIVEPMGDLYLLAHAYDDMGEAYRQAGQPEPAWHHLKQSAEIKRQLDDLSGQADTAHHLGQLCADQGEHERAVAYYRQALELRERQGSESEGAAVLVSLAGALYQLRADEMRAVADRARALAERLGCCDLLARLLWLEAEAARSAGRP